MLTRSGLATCCAALVTVVLATVAPAYAQNTVLYFDSQPGDYIGQGQVRTFAPPGATFTVTSSGGGVTVSISGPSSSDWWSLSFSAPMNAPLTVGTYAPALDVSQPAPMAGFSMSGSGRGCDNGTGRFDVLEIVRDGSGAIVRFAADLEQHCEDAAPAVFAAIRYNSTIAGTVPFGGNYPRYELHVSAPSNGQITASGIACGGGETACSTTFGAVTSVALAANANDGYVFAGWTGACRGGPQTTVNVNTVKSCGALFAPEPPPAPRSVLAIYVEPGEHPGGTPEEVYTPANSTWTLQSLAGGNGVLLRVVGMGRRDAADWQLRLAAPAGTMLAPGAYVSALQFGEEFVPSLEIRESSSSCGVAAGRFTIHQLEIDSGGTVLKLSADVEQHCLGASVWFAAIRYNSSRPGIVPFGSVTPRYDLTMTPHPNGVVSGGGLSCGAGNTTCTVSFASATTVTLSAVANSGYIFAGWTGPCSGNAATTIVVQSIRACAAVFQPLVPQTPRTLLFVDSQQGSIAGQRKVAFNPAGATFTISVVAEDAVSVLVESLQERWTFQFRAPRGSALTPGVYGAARRWPFTPFNALSVSANSSGCNTLTGRFIVHEIQFGGDGSVTRFAADAEHHCGNQDPGLFAAIRLNSSVPSLPFGGAYPWYELSVNEPANGRVTGGPLNCGGAGTACWVTFLGATPVTLTAVPDPGYEFAGWTGACTGGQTITLKVNSTMACGALFLQAASAAPRTVLYWESQQGDSVGAGEHEIYNAVNSLWTAEVLDNGNGIRLAVESLSEERDSLWDLWFRAPEGAALVPGVYEGATRAAFRTTTPGLDVYGNGRGCNIVVGRFTVHEFTTDHTGGVTALAIDFEQRCSTSSPALIGTLRFNSAVPVAVRDVSLEVDRAQPVRYGTAITFTASAHPSTGIEYSFWRLGPGGSWMLVQPYSTAATHTWTPVLADVGAHAIQVWARRIGSGAAYDVWAGTSVAIEADPPPSIVSLSNFPTVTAGTQVTWTAVAVGGVAPLQYKFWRLDGSTWKLVQDYSTSNSYTWTPGAVDAGPHALQVWVRSAGSPAAYDAYRGVGVTVTLPNPVTVLALTPNTPLPAPAGQSVAWTASATGGLGPLQYQFWRLDADGWKLAQPYSTNPVYSWTPGLADVGEHALQVWARSNGSTAPYEAWYGASFTISPPAPPVVTSLSASSDGPLQAGAAHTWTATATGGTAPLLFQFWRRDADGWKMVRNYQSSPSFTWTPGLADVGDHDLQVWVRSTGSSVPWEAYRGVSFSVVEPPIAVTLSASVSLPSAVGQSIQWQASAAGGVAPLQYQFWRLDADGWKMVQAYSSSTTYTWTPAGADAGSHALQVWVRSAGSSRAYDAWAGTPMFVITP